VNIPVKLYSATHERVLRFHLLHKECGTPLEYKRWCPKCNKEVAWEDVVKGYKLGEKYIPIEKDELEKIKLKTLKLIEIKEFVDAGQIDPLFVKKNYYIVPQEGAEKAYSLFREVLEISGKVAIGKVVLRGKEYVVAIRPYQKGLILSVLYYKDEILPVKELKELKKIVVVGEEELKLAKALIERMSGEFEFEKYKDRFREKVEKLIESKAQGLIVEEAGEEEEKPAGDILDALKASLKLVEKKKKNSS
jgi:DNA end-binding protein Ku